ncbi:hypothetical protein GYA13_00685 [Candidatus Kuenenbacteria bacterium]|nr:hypothetical protein [Candidatus Kuenenbacteria bacterium]
MANKNQPIQTTITEEVPEWKISLAYWYAENRALIKKAAVFALFFVDLTVVILWGMIFVNYRAGLLNDEVYLFELPRNLVNNSALINNAPRNLTFDDPIILSAGAEKNNLLVLISNDNSDWAVEELNYTFNVNGQDLETMKAVIPPQTERYLAYFNAPIGNNANLKIISLKWKRIRDYTLISYKDNLKVSQAQFTPANADVISGVAKFNLNNYTPYNFWEVGLTVLLFDQEDNPIAVNYLTINKFKSREERQIEVSYSEPIYRTVARVGVYPEVNWFDARAIMPTEGGVGDPAGLEMGR